MVMKNATKPANDDMPQGRPILPDAMKGRPDARELRAFLQSYEAIDDPESREMIRNAVSAAAAESA